MNIAKTRFFSFRNLENALVEWHNGVNLLCGMNGAGKTNLLEALHLITGWGPFTGNRYEDLVAWQTCDRQEEKTRNGAQLNAELCGEHNFVITAQLRKRAVLRIDNRVSHWSDLRGCAQSLAFLPADMALIEGSPAVRRHFLDVLCALYFPLYAFKLSEYKKLLQHRRYLLVQGRSTTITQQPMALLAVWLWKCRQNVVLALCNALERWTALLPLPLEVTLQRGGLDTEQETMNRTHGEMNVENSEMLGDFQRACERLHIREQAARTPLVGPHRDELLLRCRSTDRFRAAAELLSRGQRRRTALALVMSAASVVEGRYRTAPILLFDEVTSELDSVGRSVLAECFTESKWQIFAATAEDTFTNLSGVRWRIEAGRITNILSGGAHS